MTQAKWKESVKAFRTQVKPWKNMVSAVMYAALVFVVIYGMSDGVYDGFPAVIPYLVIALFLFMAFLRLYQYLTEDLPAAKKR